MKSFLVRRGGWLAAVAVLTAAFMSANADTGPRAVADMNTLMTRIIQPASDAVFYISRNPPGDDAAWREMERQTLTLAESANLLLMPGYDAGSERWAQDTAAMREAAIRAWRAAQQRDVDALIDLNNDLYTTCENCHEATR
jgi:hypothetical protein